MAQEMNIRKHIVEKSVEKVKQLNMKRTKMQSYHEQGKQFVRFVHDLFSKGNTMSVYANRT